MPQAGRDRGLSQWLALGLAPGHLTLTPIRRPLRVQTLGIERKDNRDVGVDFDRLAIQQRR